MTFLETEGNSKTSTYIIIRNAIMKLVVSRSAHLRVWLEWRLAECHRWKIELPLLCEGKLWKPTPFVCSDRRKVELLVIKRRRCLLRSNFEQRVELFALDSHFIIAVEDLLAKNWHTEKTLASQREVYSMACGRKRC